MILSEIGVLIGLLRESKVLQVHYQPKATTLNCVLVQAIASDKYLNIPLNNWYPHSLPYLKQKAINIHSTPRLVLGLTTSP